MTSVHRNEPGSARRLGVAATRYISATLGAVVVLNAGISDAFLICWTLASVCLGLIVHVPWFAFLPLIARRIAVPFDYPDDWAEHRGHDSLLLWCGALRTAPSLAATLLADVHRRPSHL